MNRCMVYHGVHTYAVRIVPYGSTGAAVSLSIDKEWSVKILGWRLHWRWRKEVWRSSRNATSEWTRTAYPKDMLKWVQSVVREYEEYSAAWAGHK